LAQPPPAPTAGLISDHLACGSGEFWRVLESASVCNVYFKVSSVTDHVIVIVVTHHIFTNGLATRKLKKKKTYSFLWHCCFYEECLCSRFRTCAASLPFRSSHWNVAGSWYISCGVVVSVVVASGVAIMLVHEMVAVFVAADVSACKKR